ncbi:unnamed protein product [Tenebrio molitor]|nr:unnamed protein product [Tenebrio molitor]
MKLFAVLLFSTLAPWGLPLVCYRCQSGYHTSEPCSNLVPGGITEVCDEPNSSCYESIEWFQNDVLQLVRRYCWTPPDNSTGDYCDNYNNPVGTLKYCKSCTDDYCNNKKIYEPLTYLECHT